MGASAPTPEISCRHVEPSRKRFLQVPKVRCRISFPPVRGRAPARTVISLPVERIDSSPTRAAACARAPVHAAPAAATSACQRTGEVTVCRLEAAAQQLRRRLAACGRPRKICTSKQREFRWSVRTVSTTQERISITCQPEWGGKIARADRATTGGASLRGGGGPPTRRRIPPPPLFPWLSAKPMTGGGDATLTCAPAARRVPRRAVGAPRRPWPSLATLRAAASLAHNATQPPRGAPAVPLPSCTGARARTQAVAASRRRRCPRAARRRRCRCYCQWWLLWQ